MFLTIGYNSAIFKGMNSVQEYIYNLLPAHKQRANGWISFNAPCCDKWGHERPDSKHRGNIKFTADGFIYNCFNCKFSAGWEIGSFVGKKLKLFLEYLGCEYNQVQQFRKIVDEINQSSGKVQEKIIEPRIIRSIPDNYKLLTESIEKGVNSRYLSKVYTYLMNRNSRLITQVDIYWAEGQNNFLIAGKEYGNVVGYSLRVLNDYSDNRYYHYQPSGFIYNYDILFKPRKYEIITEGILDAVSLGCISILSNKITDMVWKKLSSFLNEKSFILLPDRDKAGRILVNQIIEEKLPIQVSFPNWMNGIKDGEDAVKYYGQLYAIKKIIDNRVENLDEIKIKANNWWG